MDRPFICPSARPLVPLYPSGRNVYRPLSDPSMESKIRPMVHLNIIFLVHRPNSSMRWTVHRKNRSIRPPSNDSLGPTSEFVREMDGLNPNFGPLSTRTNGRVDGPQTAVFVREGLVSSRIVLV